MRGTGKCAGQHREPIEQAANRFSGRNQRCRHHNFILVRHEGEVYRTRKIPRDTIRAMISWPTANFLYTVRRVLERHTYTMTMPIDYFQWNSSGRKCQLQFAMLTGCHPGDSNAVGKSRSGPSQSIEGPLGIIMGFQSFAGLKCSFRSLPSKGFVQLSSPCFPDSAGFGEFDNKVIEYCQAGLPICSPFAKQLLQ